MKIKCGLFVGFVLIALISLTAYAHPGRTDANGGHYDHSTGEYHYHHGYPAHQHIDGVCPYDYDEQTNHNSNNSSSAGTYNQSTGLNNISRKNNIITPSPSPELYNKQIASDSDPELFTLSAQYEIFIMYGSFILFAIGLMLFSFIDKFQTTYSKNHAAITSLVLIIISILAFIYIEYGIIYVLYLMFGCGAVFYLIAGITDGKETTITSKQFFKIANILFWSSIVIFLLLALE